jgi:hypothetical protein
MAVHDGALNPTYVRGKRGSVLKLTITNLDENQHRAQIVGNNGNAEVQFHTLPGQMLFLERTPTGNPTLLSVFAPPQAGAPLPAAYSRHILISPANIAISQYAGSCEQRS